MADQSLSIISDPSGLTDRLRAERRLRSFTAIAGRSPQSELVRIDARDVHLFSTCDYLGASTHPQAADAATDALARFGVGTGGSRYIGGTTTLHELLETRLAEFHERRTAVLFNTGYMANLGFLGCLGAGDMVLSDAENHASIIDGCRLSRARREVWGHNDCDHLERLLKQHAATSRCLVVCESLYSMGGDFAPLDSIRQLTRRYNALLAVDDVHAIGVYGPHGIGLASPAGADFVLGGAGKGLGSLGGYVASDSPIGDILRSTARAFIFTISLPAPVLAATIQNIDYVRAADAARIRIHGVAQRIRARLTEQGFDIGTSQSHIVPLITQTADRTRFFQAELLRRGFYVQGVGPPTVAPGQGRLRISITACHSESVCDALVEALVEVRSLERANS